ncbi:MAG: response regulator [Thermoleophilia bacterium]|jgi:DNA-binding response OmpR family regulator
MEKKINILLIDDEEDFLEITAKRLARRGYEVRTALSCGEGISEFESGPVDVVVLDVMLPDKDGIQCLKEIKMLFPSTAVILLTGHASMEAGLECMDSGASDYCLKPVEFDDLVDRIEIVYRDMKSQGSCSS